MSTSPSFSSSLSPSVIPSPISLLPIAALSLPPMARILSKAAIRDSRALIRDHMLPLHVLPRRSQPLSSRFLSRRWRSGLSDKHAQIFEVVVETASEGGGVDVAVSSSEAAVRRLEDVIHGILARRAAPDWLPFVPGSSYWVPPRGRSYRLVDVLRRAASPMTDEEVMSLTTVKGWPCAAHLLGDSDEPPNEASTQSEEDS